MRTGAWRLRRFSPAIWRGSRSATSLLQKSPGRRLVLGFETGYLLGASRGRPFSSTNEARSAVRINRSRHREEPLTSPTGFARPTLPVEEGCWWLPVLQNGEDCLGTAAFRPNQFRTFSPRS